MFKIYEVLQEEISDCGVCSLECIIKYYNGFIPLEVLRINTNTDAYGTNAYELVNCAKKYGFNSYGKKVNTLENIKKPVIVHLKLNSGIYHFIVVYKVDKNYVYTMDPSIGKKKYKVRDFYELFTGVVLYFEPIHIIPKYQKNNNIEKSIEKELKDNRKKYLFIIFISFIILLLSIVVNLEFKILNKNSLYIYIIIFIIITLYNLIFLRNKIILKLTNRLNNTMISKFINHILKLPLKYLKLKRHGEILTRFQEIDTISKNILSLLITFIFNFILCLLLLFTIFFIKKEVIVYLIVFLIIFCIFNIHKYKKLIPKLRYIINLEESYNSSIINYMKNLETIIHYNSSKYFNKKILSNVQDRNKVKSNLLLKIESLNRFNEIIINLFLLFILLLINKDNINTIDSVSICIIYNYFINIVKEILSLYPTFIMNKTIILKNNDFLSYKEKPLKKIDNKFNNIILENLNYSINGIKVLKNINYKIKKYDKVFLKGPSGCGKSTLMKILIGEINDYGGNVLKDDINIKYYNVANFITYTSQDEMLFDDTIENNITLNKNINDTFLKKIFSICRIDEILDKKSFGLSTNVINNFNLSGGEKNRIVLARSLIHSKNIIILDEVLKELDYDTEICIVKDILKFFKNKTIIYISHKNLEKEFDKVLILGKE